MAITNCPLKTAKLQTIAKPLRLKSTVSGDILYEAFIIKNKPEPESR